MAAIVSFIGRHDSGRATLAAQVVAQLKSRGLRVAVIVSTEQRAAASEAVAAGAFRYRQAGADEVMLVAPDRMILETDPKDISLTVLAHRYLPDVDIVIGEGFSEARQIAKIEVVGDPAQCLRTRVTGVIAVVTDHAVGADYVFRMSEAAEIADFIQKRCIDSHRRRPEKTTLLVNGKKIVLKKFIQDSLAGVVAGYVKTLKTGEEPDEIELRIKF